MTTTYARRLLSSALSLGLWVVFLLLVSPSSNPSACFTSAFAPGTAATTPSTTTLVPRPPSRETHSSSPVLVAAGSVPGPEVEGRDIMSSWSSWASRALLISSLTDGVVTNPAARCFLRCSLVDALLRERVRDKEEGVRSSVEFSPCNGPDAGALDSLEEADKLLERGRQFSEEDFVDESGRGAVNSWADDALGHLLFSGDRTTKGDAVNLRVLYIPTAMYALNMQSSNTPGKQRQRARADGKKRRTQVLKLLDELLSLDDAGGEGEGSNIVVNRFNLLATTLDLNDGSLKQPVGSENASLFPATDVEAMSTWQPHLIYVEGGNTFWLQHCIDKGGYSPLIKDAVRVEGGVGAVYIGKSAGAIIAGGLIETATWKGWDDPSVVPGKESYEEWMGCRGLNFVGSGGIGNGDLGLSFFPHMSDDWNDLVGEKIAAMDNASRGSSICCLREEDACCVIGERRSSFVISGPPPI